MRRRRPDASSTSQTARSLFLRDDNYFGCAESTLVALQTIFGLPDAEDSAAAVALNGGVAYSGGICGAISGAAIALGRLAESRLGDHQAAKRAARVLTQRLMDEFAAAFGSVDCRDLIDYEISIPAEHDAFIASDVWRDTCMRQIEFSIGKLSPLVDEETWCAVVAEL